MKRQLHCAALVFVTSLIAVAQTSRARVYRSGNEWVREISNTLPSAKVVKVKSWAGSIRVKGGEQKSITYTVRERVHMSSEESARHEFSRMRFTVNSSGDVMLLRADCEGAVHGAIDFEVQLPSQTSWVDLKTEGGAVTAQNIQGKVEASTGGGDIQLDQIGGLISAVSGGGHIEIGRAAGDVIVTTGGGSIHIVSAKGRVAANSGGGDLTVDAARAMSLQTGGGNIKVNRGDGQITAKSGGGNIDLNTIEGPTHAQTGGGHIYVRATHGAVNAETGSGPISATFAPGGSSFANSRLETAVGDVIVYVPADLGVTIQAAVEAARGDGIYSDFPELKTTISSGPGPHEAHAEGNLHGGGPVLLVHTGMGKIEIKKNK